MIQNLFLLNLSLVIFHKDDDSQGINYHCMVFADMVLSAVHVESAAAEFLATVTSCCNRWINYYRFLTISWYFGY